MLRPRHALFLAVLLVALAATGGCAYESSGTTTTITVAEEEQPPPLGPATIAFEDQRIEGSAVVIDSVQLPAAGFIVLQEDVAGSPGELIGVSEVVGPGRIEGVPVPFFVPLDADAFVHATLHIDVDRSRTFLYEPPDAFVDVPATDADGAVAAGSAMVVLLPPLGPSEILVEEARIVGTAVEVASVTLPAAGFVAVQRNEGGLPGQLLGASDLLAEGTTSGLSIALDPPLRITGLVWVVPYVDRDEDGVLSIGAGDEPAEAPDGSPALASPVMTVIALDPSLVSVADQEGDGTSIVVESATFPNPGYLEVLRDAGGLPGAVIGRSELIGDTTVADVSISLDSPLDADATLWVRIRIDFDEDRQLTDQDPQGLTEDGEPALGRFTYTFIDPDADDGDGDGQ